MFFKNKFQKSNYSFVIAGLGNPGDKYKNTKHNVGFMAADLIAENYNMQFKKSKFNAEVCDCKIKDTRCLIVKPQTFMNNSGEALKKVLSFYKVPVDNLIVIFDDISLEPGKIRVRRKGTDGGHNGIKSIISNLKSEEFKRVRIGVGAKPNKDFDLAAWVLSDFSKEIKPEINKAVNMAKLAVETIITSDVDTAMSQYNGA